MKNVYKFIFVAALLGVAISAFVPTFARAETNAVQEATTPFISEPPIVPKFTAGSVQTSALVIKQVSRFRSLVGHPYCGSTPKCQSEKHYFAFCENLRASDILVRAPSYGTITTILDESPRGYQIEITIDTQKYPDYKGRNIAIILFHINPFKPLYGGQKVTPGEELGTHATMDTYSDLAIREYYNDKDPVLRSAFLYMTPAVLKMYGINDPNKMIISQNDRDAYPSDCNLDPNNHDPMPPPKKQGGPEDWVVLIPSDDYCKLHNPS